MIKYSKIFKEAFEVTKRYQAMWWLGMLVAGSSSGCNARIPGNFGGLDNVEQWDTWSSVAIQGWLIAHWWLISLIGLLLVALFIIAMLFNYIAIGGMYYGAQQTVKNQVVKLNELFRYGIQQFVRVLGLRWLVSGGIVLALMLIAIPLIALAFTVVGLIIVIPAVILLILAFIPFGVVIQIILQYAQQYLVLQQQTILISLQSGWQLFRKHLADSIIIYLLTVLVRIGVAMATILVVLFISLPFAILGFILYNTISWPGVIDVVVLAVMVLLVALYIIRGISQTFYFHLWHRTYATLAQR